MGWGQKGFSGRTVNSKLQSGSTLLCDEYSIADIFLTMVLRRTLHLVEFCFLFTLMRAEWLQFDTQLSLDMLLHSSAFKLSNMLKSIWKH